MAVNNSVEGSGVACGCKTTEGMYSNVLSLDKSILWNVGPALNQPVSATSSPAAAAAA